MSRSNPTDNSPSPVTRWFEWDGSNGKVRFYDKEKKENVEAGTKFTFILLDRLATIKGWHEASESSIYSNEVRDTRAESLVVKAFKGGVLAEGVYSQIRDRVKVRGGNFVANLYIGYRDDGELKLGSLQLKGAALHAWMDFEKDNRSEVYKGAVKITGSKSGKKGKIEFESPIFAMADLSPETNAEAIEIDKGLQAYLKAYFARTRTEQVSQPVGHEPEPDDEPRGRESERGHEPDDDENPF